MTSNEVTLWLMIAANVMTTAAMLITISATRKSARSSRQIADLYAARRRDQD